MLANVKFCKKIFLFLIIFVLPENLYPYEKEQIIIRLKNLNSLEFTFNQSINNKNEKGFCILVFPGKLKCNYYDDNERELLITKLAITQKDTTKLIVIRYQILL